MPSGPSSGDAPCRFCGRAPAPGQHRVSGPLGPICAECIESGLRVTATRKQPEAEGERLVRLRANDQSPCELCERYVRLSFLGFRRSLARARGLESDAVICVDCLDWGGNLINRAIRG